MPSIKDESTVEAIAVEYTSNGRNKEQAMRTIGYAESTCQSGKGVGDVYGKLRVKQAIARIDAKIRAEVEYDKKESLKRKQILYEATAVGVKAGSMDAIRTANAVLKQCDNITGLEQQHLHQHGQDAPEVELTPLQARAQAKANMAYKLEMAKGEPRLSQNAAG